MVVLCAWQTGSDCEVILPLYLKYGPDCISRLRGQFAFVLVDTRDDSFLIGRDHIGLCPLYWVRQNWLFWLIEWLVGWLVGWLVDWLVGWLGKL